MSGRESLVFADFVAARAGALHRTAYLIVGDADRAVDLVTEALTRACVGWRRLREPPRAEVYARRVVALSAIGPGRRQAGDAEGTEPVTDPDPLWDALQRLPVRRRAALVLRHHDALTEAQVADALGSAPGPESWPDNGADSRRLAELMADRADALDPPVIDLEAITTEAARRRTTRRRRVTGAGCAVAGLGAVVAVVATLGGVQRSAGHDEIVLGGDPVWSSGHVIHAGGSAVDVLHEVDRFVQVREGFVLADADHRVYASIGGRVTSLGAVAADGALRSDGSTAAWDGPDGFIRTADESGGVTTAARLPIANARLLAVDGPDVYYRNAQGVGRYDLAAGQDVLLMADPNRGYQFFDAEGGVLVHGVPGEGSGTVAVNSSVVEGSPSFRLSGSPDLSPASTYVMSNGDGDFRVYAVATGQERTPGQKDGYALLLGYRWVDDDHYMALGLQSRDPGASVAMLVCSASARACSVTDEALRYGAFQVPDGDHIGD